MSPAQNFAPQQSEILSVSRGACWVLKRAPQPKQGLQQCSGQGAPHLSPSLLGPVIQLKASVNHSRQGHCLGSRRSFQGPALLCNIHMPHRSPKRIPEKACKPNCPFSVSWGCQDKTPQTGWLKQQTFLTALEAGSQAQGAGRFGPGEAS